MVHIYFDTNWIFICLYVLLMYMCAHLLEMKYQAKQRLLFTLWHKTHIRMVISFRFIMHSTAPTEPASVLLRHCDLIYGCSNKRYQSLHPWRRSIVICSNYTSSSWVHCWTIVTTVCCRANHQELTKITKPGTLFSINGEWWHDTNGMLCLILYKQCWMCATRYFWKINE